jgi:dephospho-CoA kinase
MEENNMLKKRVYGLTGMPGSGKGIFRNKCCKFGYKIIIMGDEIRAEAKRRNLNLTPKNLGRLMLDLRNENGPEIIAKKCISKIKSKKSHLFLIDGIRSLHEVKEFRKVFPSLEIVAIHSSPNTRFSRLVKRNRTDDPKNWETFIERDQRELNVGIGDVIATADYMIVNEGTKRKLNKIIKNFLEHELKT